MSSKVLDSEPRVLESKGLAEQHPVEISAGLNGLFHDIDGGLRGWASVIGCWLFQFSMIGTVTAFGSYQSFYQEEWLMTYSESTIAWIGSMQLFLEFFLGVFGGVLLDGGHWRAAMVGGSGVFVVSFFMLSLCKEGQYAPIILSQGVGMGLGLGLAFLPLFGVVAKHFTKRRSLAMGILTTGSSLGGFAFSVLVNKLFRTNLGFAWTVRVNAFIVLGCLVLANVLIREPKPLSASSNEMPSSSRERKPGVVAPDQPEEDKPRGIPELLRDPAYLAVIGSGFFVCLGLYFPMFVIQSFALEHGVAPSLADWLLSIMNLSGVLGRTVPNWLADHYGVLEFYVPCTTIAGVLVLSLGTATNSGGIILVSVFYGFFAGSVVSLYFPTVCALDPYVTSAGLRLGIACLPLAFAALIGTPITEAIIGTDQNWWHGIAFAGTTILVAAALLAFAWVVERRRKGTKKMGKA